MEINHSTKILVNEIIKKIPSDIQENMPDARELINQVINDLELLNSSFDRETIQWDSFPFLLRDELLKRYDESHFKFLLQAQINNTLND